jgi:hypothetical protein
VPATGTAEAIALARLERSAILPPTGSFAVMPSVEEDTPEHRRVLTEDDHRFAVIFEY